MTPRDQKGSDHVLDKLSPSVRAEVDGIVSKWTAFTQKVNGRVEEVVAEARAGLDQLIHDHTLDHGPIGAAMSAVQVRFKGLGPKVQEAFEKSDHALDEVMARDLSQQDMHAVIAIRDVMIKQERALIDHIDDQYERLMMQKNADWARRLRQLAQEETSRGAPCSSCGAPFPVQVFWAASQARCPHCNAVNDLYPGVAAGSFYQGLGVHALAHEAAFGEWEAEQRADHALKAFRHATAYDRWLYVEAARAYWAKYYGTVKQLNPGFDGNIDSAVAAKLAHYSAWDAEVDKQKRDFLGALVDASRKRDGAALKQLLGARPHHVDLDSCAEALMERGDVEGTTFVLDVKYDADQESDPRAAWIREQLADVARTVRK